MVVFMNAFEFSDPDKQDADGLSHCILKQFNLVLENESDKLITQVYTLKL